MATGNDLGGFKIRFGLILFYFFPVPHLNYTNCDPQGKHIYICDVFSSAKTKDLKSDADKKFAEKVAES